MARQSQRSVSHENSASPLQALLSFPQVPRGSASRQYERRQALCRFGLLRTPSNCHWPLRAAYPTPAGRRKDFQPAAQYLDALDRMQQEGWERRGNFMLPPKKTTPAPTSLERKPSWVEKSCRAMRLFRFLDEYANQLTLGPFDHLQTLEKLVNNVTAEDFNVHQSNIGSFPVGNSEDTGYQLIHESSNLSVVIWTLPPGEKFPLSDAPGHFLFTRLLFGRARIKTFEPLEIQAYWRLNFSVTELAEEIIDAPKTYNPSPNRGEWCIHEVEVLEPSAILDIQFPRWVNIESRPLTFYRMARDSATGNITAVPLETMPKTLSVLAQPYLGPQFPYVATTNAFPDMDRWY